MTTKARSRKRRSRRAEHLGEDDFIPSRAAPARFGLPEGSFRRGDELLWDEAREEPPSYRENARSRAQAPDPNWVDHAWSQYLGARTRR